MKWAQCSSLCLRLRDRCWFRITARWAKQVGGHAAKDNQTSCEHVAKAKKSPAFMELLGQTVDDDYESEEDGEEGGQAAAVRERGKSSAWYPCVATDRNVADRNSIKELYDERSVSWQPVGPPAWCRLDSDTVPSIRTVKQIPDRLPLGDDARCRCGNQAVEGASIVTLEATVYGSSEAYKVEIELQKCIRCPAEAKQFIGPDLRDLGIFNYNNRRLYTHELLNRFTNSISAHETPFYAFCTVISRSYVEAESAIDFVPDNAFRTAYFSFTRIQQLGDSFQCDICGPNPRVVIFDGVTAGFHNAHQTSTLCPPTLIMPDAPVRENVRPPVSSTALVWGKLRMRAQKAVRWRLQLKGSKSKVAGVGVDKEDEDEDDADDAADADVDLSAAAKQMKKRVSKRDALDADMRNGLPGIASELARLDRSLSTMFDTFVNTEYDRDSEAGVRPYLELLEHVSIASV